MAERTEVIVVGGGQSGLVAGYYLKKAGIPFVILDEETRLGEAWRRRWDSLKLFTIAEYCALPGLRFPGNKNHFPGKDEMADYVEAYAREHDLPVHLGTKVTSLDPIEDGYRLQTSRGVYEAPQVIIATGAYRLPKVPDLAAGLSDDVFQIHTGAYHNPSQIPGQTVVVVGAANSGAQIAPELTRTHRVLLSQGSHLPAFGRKFLGKGLHWWGDKFGLISKPLIGERDRLHKKTILVGPSLKKISRKYGVELVGRTIACEGNTVRFEDGRSVETDAVVWATGFQYDYSWVHAPIHDQAGTPVQERGVTQAPGLYVLGMQCQYSYGSALIWWVKDDASYLVDQIKAYRPRHTATAGARPQRG
ncbi:NAD(P)/FAD-dependent oxidoreductase [Sphaerisporangium rubeum]|uniref:Putative flavoprotein involved in K+ transport n=1 Tax=Sphaerisporangium rubeum TaxID=321317 RepID=A0A7X0IIS5_9ACTN|nr:NAD(P)/FAD-dependent oxidoreductase [Sphaerisporangium rubeum]MBB6475688.1 putative flavoprotein involved in K+ transport [Sphaerisporangium rubeum]